MWTATTVEELRRLRASTPASVALVPTMGALHAGHVSLFESARAAGHAVTVSIFVNPTQFGPNEDFNRYPRPIEQDLAACRRAGVTAVFHPSVEEIYPPGQPECLVTVPALADILEGAHRPGHFAGVCRVVAKLFNLVQPDVAYFGQKDYQQLRIIEAMARDLAMPVRIVGCPTVREPQGLAMSSRNAYLTDEQRHQALAIYRSLGIAKALVQGRQERDPSVVESAMQRELRDNGLQVDYAVVRDARTLAPLQRIEPRGSDVVALVAARVGNVRLIDNMVLKPPMST
jgi:pantoate--beta-alanine ligase